MRRDYIAGIARWCFVRKCKRVFGRGAKFHEDDLIRARRGTGEQPSR